MCTRDKCQFLAIHTIPIHTHALKYHFICTLCSEVRQFQYPHNEIQSNIGATCECVVRGQGSRYSNAQRSSWIQILHSTFSPHTHTYVHLHIWYCIRCRCVGVFDCVVWLRSIEFTIRPTQTQRNAQLYAERETTIDCNVKWNLFHGLR